MAERDKYDQQHLGNFKRSFPNNDYVSKIYRLTLTYRIFKPNMSYYCCTLNNSGVSKAAKN